jgi:hypothetical protein
MRSDIHVVVYLHLKYSKTYSQCSMMLNIKHNVAKSNILWVDLGGMTVQCVVFDPR